MILRTRSFPESHLMQFRVILIFPTLGDRRTTVVAQYKNPRVHIQQQQTQFSGSSSSIDYKIQKLKMDFFSISRKKKSHTHCNVHESIRSAAAVLNEIVYRFLNDLVCLFHNLSCVRKCTSIDSNGHTQTHRHTSTRALSRARTALPSVGSDNRPILFARDRFAAWCTEY